MPGVDGARPPGTSLFDPGAGALAESPGGTKTPYDKLNAEQKRFVRKNPAAALRADKLAQIARNEAAKRYPKQADQKDGPGDAFRHAYWNALMTREMGRTTAKEIADANEAWDWNPPGDPAREMDMYNNAVGRDIGAPFIQPTLSGGGISRGTMTQVADAVQKALNAGRLRWINN
jgi:hypothetical protein